MMRMFFLPSELKCGSVISFDHQESKHIAKVLRLNKGDYIQVTNGDGQLFKAQLVDDHFKLCKAEVLSQIHVKKPKRPYFHLFVAPPKSKQRWEWLLEKTTEIGVDQITPIICNKSERRKIDYKRSNLMLINALKQSQQVKLPFLNEINTFNEVISQKHDFLQLIAHCDEEIPVYTLKDFDQNIDKINILIGPEGDFTSDEINQALKNHYFALNLGENRLRIETAAIVAAQKVASIY
jgi:16S rRNA (uracil1498-N3)-methyltransferase